VVLVLPGARRLAERLFLARGELGAISLLSHSFHAQYPAEVHPRDYRNGTVGLEVKEMVVVGNDDVRRALRGAFEDAVVVRVRRNDVEHRARDDNAGAGDLGDAPASPSGRARPAKRNRHGGPWPSPG